MKKLAFLFLLMGCTPAAAGVPCSLPFNLQNGQPADATQVMANYNALVTCLGNAAAAGPNSDLTSITGLTVPLSLAQGGTPVYVGSTSTGTANAQVVATTIPANFVLGNFQILFTAGLTNTGATTLNVNSTGAVVVRKQTSTGLAPLLGSELTAGQVYAAFYDGTFWQVLNPSASSAVTPPSSITAVYSVVTTDCGKILSLGGGTFFTVTFPAAGGYPAGCVITLVDSDTVRGKAIVAGGNVIRLFPSQTRTVTQTGGQWSLNPQAQFWTTPGTFFVNHTFGSDNPAASDCLATGAGACSTFQTAVNIIQNFTLPDVSGTTIQADCEAPQPYTQTALGPANSIQLYRGLGGIINLVGNASAPLNCAIEPSISTTIVDVQDGQQMTMTGFTLGFTSGTGGTAFNGRQIVIADLNNSVLANTPSGTMVNATDLASVNLTSVSLTGAANVFVAASNGAQVQVNGVAVAAATSANITFWYDVINGAAIAGTPAYAVAGTVSGQQFACSTNAVLNLGSPYPAALTAGTAVTGCQHSP